MGAKSSKKSAYRPADPGTRAVVHDYIAGLIPDLELDLRFAKKVVKAGADLKGKGVDYHDHALAFVRFLYHQTKPDKADGAPVNPNTPPVEPNYESPAA